MSWENQGRQEHGWFGHGTAPLSDHPPLGGTGGMFTPGSLPARIDAVAHGALPHLPRADWLRGAASFNQERLAQLHTAMTPWIGASTLSDAAFGARFTAPMTSAAAIEKLRAATDGVRRASTHQDLAAAAADLAAAMRGISLDRWPRFLHDAATRAAGDASTTGRLVLAQATHPNTATDAGPASSPGRYVADNPRQWIGQPSVGNGECVPLVQAATGAPRSAEWRRGVLVQGNMSVRFGAAIATFDDQGRYTGHTAIYLGQDERGIRVIDQWNRWRNGQITDQHRPSERTLHLGDTFRDTVDRGESYYVIE